MSSDDNKMRFGLVDKSYSDNSTRLIANEDSLTLKDISFQRPVCGSNANTALINDRALNEIITGIGRL
jgi:hypothetical protein